MKPVLCMAMEATLLIARYLDQLLLLCLEQLELLQMAIHLSMVVQLILLIRECIIAQTELAVATAAVTLTLALGPIMGEVEILCARAMRLPAP